MERLTYRDANGECWYCGEATPADRLHRLTAYEDTGLEPAEIENIRVEMITCYDESGVAYSVNAEGSEAKHITDLLMAESQGRLVVQKTVPGQEVWIVEPDEYGEPYEISGYMFLASVKQAVIVTPYINDTEDLDESLDYHIEETMENYDTNLSVFPAESSYLTREEAEAALQAQKGKRRKASDRK